MMSKAWLSFKAWLAARQWKSFISGQETVAEEFEAWLTERSVSAKRHGLEVTLEGIEHANKLEAEGERDKAKADCIAAYKASLVEMTQARARVLASATPEEVDEALAAPFAGGASPSATPSGSGSKAIENHTENQANGRATTSPDALPVRRGPGRPRKNQPQGE